MKHSCTGVILAGGANSRLPGKKKTFHKVGKTMILEKIIDVFSKIFDEIIIVVNDPQDFKDLDMMVVTDIIPAKCALAGLHTGLFYSSNEYIYVTACDTPFIQKEIIEYITDQIEPGYDVVLQTNEGLEALSAVYSKECIPFIENNLEKNIFMIKKFFRRNKVKKVPVEDLKCFDPDLRFVFNVNTKKDLEAARQMIK